MSIYIWITLLLTSPFFIFLGLLIYWYKEQYKYRGLDHLPGPKPLPIIGNALLFNNLTPPHFLKTLENLQNQYGRICKIWVGPRIRLLINKPECLEQLLGSTENISKSSTYTFFYPWLGLGLLTSTGAKWKRHRKIITPTFHFKVLEDFMQVFNQQTDIMIKKVMEAIQANPNELIDIFHYVNLLSLDNICETSFGVALGVQQDRNRKYVDAVDTCAKTVMTRTFAPLLAYDSIFKLSKYSKPYYDDLRILLEFTEKIITSRKAELAKNGEIRNIDEHGIRVKKAFLDMLLEANQDSQILSDRDLRDEVNTLLFEGHDTTTSGISYSFYALATNPKIQEKLYKELSEYFGNESPDTIKLSDLNNLKYLENVFKEALRMYPPVPMIERCLDTDWILKDGTKIPKGTEILINIYGMGRDPEVFPNPEIFNPDRFLPENQVNRHNYAYLPFSAGPRNCIGQRHAVSSAKTTIAKFVLNFKLEADPLHVPDSGFSTTLRSTNGIKIKITPRNK